MNSLQVDLREHALRAFSLMTTILGVLEPFDNLRQNRVIEAATDRSRALAHREYERRGAQGISSRDFVMQGLTEVIREMKGVAAHPVDPDEAHAISLMDTRLCELKEGGEVPDVLTASFNGLSAVARTFYTNRLVLPLEYPQLILCLSDSPDINKSLPGRPISFSGSVSFDDRSVGKKSEVKLRVTPAQVDFGCLSTLPYVLMHELLCHWPQMATSTDHRSNPGLEDDCHKPGGRRVKVDAVAEAWVDRYVAKAIRSMSNDPIDALSKAAAVAETIHRDRVNAVRNPVYADAARIAVGEDVAACIETLYCREGDGNITKATFDTERLACELNVADWNYNQRTLGCHRIVIACRKYFRPDGQGLDTRDHHVMAALLDFRKSFQVGPVLKALTER